ncbi:MAG: hypothetical protein RLZZ350_1511, partial [Verrucomicrobiota bacterium]
MRFKTYLLAMALGSAALPVGAADEAKPVMLAETPAVVQKVIQTQVADGKLTQLTRTEEKNETVYEATRTLQNGDEQDFSVADDGTLLSVEVALAATPAVVRQAIQTQANGWELESIDKNVDEAEISFDVEISKAGRTNHFSIGDDGELLSREIAVTAAPAAVQTALTKLAAHGKLKSLREIPDADGNTYEATLGASGDREKTYSLNADGQISSESVTLDEVPAPVRKTIKEKLGDGRVLGIEKLLLEKKSGVLPYEVQGRKAGKPFDFSVGPHGRFLGM